MEERQFGKYLLKTNRDGDAWIFPLVWARFLEIDAKSNYLGKLDVWLCKEGDYTYIGCLYDDEIPQLLEVFIKLAS